MIDVALDFLGRQLKPYLDTHTGFDDVHVAPSRLVDNAGKMALADETVGLTLINVEEERVFKDQVPSQKFVNGQHVVLAPELRLNLMVLISANYAQYNEALKCLSLVFTYFQTNLFFTVERYPTLEPRIGKLTVELQSLTFEQLNQVWAFLGAKYLPSVVYRVRMVTLQDVAPMAIGAPITSISTTLGNR
ncbi:MAG: DUF4255 domain-containing protein [Gemmatimonadaceae bacterium]